jgi:A/G-specific adenine glycosylase
MAIRATRCAPMSEGVRPAAARRRAFARELLAWYEQHQRDLPWRRTRDPYAIWVSEIMLQQTQVATVIPYFERWMQRFPDVTALAAAAEADVLHAWQGLGYYSRARNLLAGARRVVSDHAGVVPDDVEALLTLPGIGRYSAGAIASIAYGRPAPIVDGNVVRVLCRVFGLKGDPARAPLKSALWRLAEDLIPAGRAAVFNQALMELGATVCTPKQPSCETCPLRAACVAKQSGLVLSLPELAKRPEITAVSMVAALVFRRGRVLVTQLAPDAPRWAGMWQFPNTECRPSESSRAALERALSDVIGVGLESARTVTSIRHSVTRYRITLDAYLCEPRAPVTTGRSRADLAWVAPHELEDLAMPAAHRRLARYAAKVHAGAE